MIPWRRKPPPRPEIERDEVLDILEALTDIKAWTYEILEILRDEDAQEEDA